MSAAFGGTPFRGITYRADGDWVIAVSSSTGHEDYGYRDGWLDDARSRFKYSGEWHGCGDMTFSGGNAAIRDRSGRIFLFIKEDDAFVYRGRFRLEGLARELMLRPTCGHRHTGIRFDFLRG
jgi:hypothetical protein